MKKIASIIIVLVMLLSFTACGSSNTPTPPAEQVQNTPATEAPAEESIDVPVEEPPVEDTTAAQEPLPFQEILVVDNDDCSIKITEIEEDNLWGYTLKALLENKTTDKVLMFSVDSAAINGVMADPLFASEVAAGKKSNEEISFNDELLEKNGINKFTDVEINFRVYDSEDWTADPVAEVTAHVYPYGEENAEIFARELQPTDTILADNEYVTVIFTGCEDDDIWGYSANLYIVNKTETSIMVSVDEASINGFMIDPFYADTVNAGKVAFSTISWFDTDLEENSITEVESIEFVLHVYDNEDWSGDDFYNDIVTITP